MRCGTRLEIVGNAHPTKTFKGWWAVAPGRLLLHGPTLVGAHLRREIDDLTTEDPIESGAIGLLTADLSLSQF